MVRTKVLLRSRKVAVFNHTSVCMTHNALDARVQKKVDTCFRFRRGSDDVCHNENVLINLKTFFGFMGKTCCINRRDAYKY